MDTERKASSLLEVPAAAWESSRFRVARVSIGGGGGLPGSGSESPYESSASRSLGQLTREALPRAENYRDITSAAHALRPTLEELHEARFLDEVRIPFYLLLPNIICFDSIALGECLTEHI